MQSGDGPAAKAWDGSRRVTALLMGLDFRDWEANEPAARTDSMMLVTYDPISNTAGMMSIPRDMWVYIPGFDHGLPQSAAHKADVAMRRAVLALEPENVPALSGMAALEYARGAYLEARAFAERWLALAPDDPAALQLAARIEEKTGDNVAASRYLLRLQAISSGSSTVLPRQ